MLTHESMIAGWRITQSCSEGPHHRMPHGRTPVSDVKDEISYSTTIYPKTGRYKLVVHRPETEKRNGY